MIRNIVFDMGNVLIHWYPDIFVERLELPEEDQQQLKQEVYGREEWTLLDQGMIESEEAIAAMCRRLPERLHGVARELTLNWWKPAPIPVVGMAELIRELKGMQYGIYLLSNAGADNDRYFGLIPGSECFDGKIISALWKLLKPQREIYEVLFQEYGLKPEECFFIDDLPANIQGARDAGMDGAVFGGDVAHLRRQLRDAGIPVNC